METRGFNNLNLINKSIRELYRAMTPRKIRTYTANFVLGESWDDVSRDPILGTQRLAKRIATQYQLAISTVIVSFSVDLKVPGRVELSSSNDFFVELQSQYREDPKAIAAVLAHEIAHIFLHRNKIHFPNTFENEILTDTTAVYLGFGHTILNAATERESYPSHNTVQTHTHHFGYLSLNEFGYLLAKRDAIFGGDSSTALESDLSRLYLQSGRSRLQRELRTRPLVARPWHQRISYFMLGNDKTKILRPISFPCPCCSQTLRIPETHKKLSVRCPNCDSRFLSYS